MAHFSSNGPTWDGRIKPDILAPGWVLSAKTGQTDPDASGDAFHCSVLDSIQQMQGTSMATPGAYCAAASMICPRAREYTHTHTHVPNSTRI
jgi:hypothetical protein